jgi:hypothetical protein
MSAEELLNPTKARGPNQGTELTQAMSPDETAGAVIGRYHLLQKIGEGGMGEVWLAEQKEPVRRRVALKLVKAGMNSREVTARFESERQACEAKQTCGQITKARGLGFNHFSQLRLFRGGRFADTQPARCCQDSGEGCFEFVGQCVENCSPQYLSLGVRGGGGGRSESLYSLQGRGRERCQCRRRDMRVTQALEANGAVDPISGSQALYGDLKFGKYGVLTRQETVAGLRFQITA